MSLKSGGNILQKSINEIHEKVSLAESPNSFSYSSFLIIENKVVERVAHRLYQ